MDTPYFSGLKAVIFNGTLTRSPGVSHTNGLIDACAHLMIKNGVEVEVIRTVDHQIPPGVYPDMTEHGWEVDEWPSIFERVKEAHIVILAGPIWLGDNSSQTKKIVERLYSNSAEVNEAGQYIYYGKVGGAIITGNEDGIKHCAMNLLYSLQHIGCTIAPQADAGWIGEVGPGPSYLDEGSGGPESDFTNQNLTFMTYNLMHLARMLRDQGGIPTYGNIGEQWQQGERFGYVPPSTT